MLNITLRLLTLFPFLDTTPQNGVVSLKELEAWNVQQAVHRLNYRTQKEMTVRDKDGDGAITLRECLPQFSDEEIERNDKTHGQAGWWKEQFTNADADGNGFLSLAEFNDFLHPEDSVNEEIQEWLAREKIRVMDYDKDGKLSFIEFRDQAYDIYINHPEFDNHEDDVPNPEEKFSELDVNLDKFMTEEELLPILHHLQPGEISYATYYANYLIHEADDDKDGSLTLNEMIRHEDVFYSAVFEESDFDDDDYDLHNEL